MDCKYVRESSCLAFCFHPSASSLFYLTNTKNRLRVIEQNLYTGLVVTELAVPLREQNLSADNYVLNFCPDGRQVILTLSNHILIFSLELKSLLFIGEAIHGKIPCFIQKALVFKRVLYFAASDHHQIFAMPLRDCIANAAMPTFTRYKMPAQARATGIAIGNGKLISICSDNNLRVWDIQSGNSLKGVILQRIGELTSITFSKSAEYLLIGTSTGHIQVWDGATLGINNTQVLSKPVCKQYIQSLSWFHYSGEGQSRRFLMLTRDGNVKLFSFYFQRAKKGDQKWMGKANELLLLFNNKSQMGDTFDIRSHEYANFIYFHPGILLYLVDYFPRIYFPLVASQLSPTFEALVPNQRKEIYIQPNFLYLEGLIVKRLRNQSQNKVSLSNVIEYEGLKVLRVDYRPKFSTLQELPIQIKKGVPSRPIRYKFLVNYILGNMIRSMVISNISLASANQNIDSYRELSGHSAIFLGPPANIQPLILILLEDKSTITVVCEHPASELDKYLQQERPYLCKAGQIYNKQLKIKIQKIFETPFRNGYVVLYLSDNLLRFSNNIHVNSQLLDYEVFQGIGLRLDFNDIVIQVVWSSRGEIGCVVCLQKIIFINDELKILKVVPIDGYVVQGQFVGYTLIVTTKVDVQYVDISGKALQLYCIENYQSRYLVFGVLTDRIIGIQKSQGVINCKVRYFNLMQPLLAGYINYYNFAGAVINADVLKRVIEGFAPYHIISEQFIQLLNRSGLSSFSRYFIQSHVKLYSRAIRAATMNSEAKIERFIPPKVWMQNSRKILDNLLYYQELKNSSDQYDKQRSLEYQRSLINLVGSAFQSIKNAVDQQQSKASTRLTIAANFGEQAHYQVFYQYSDKQNVFVKMELLPFKASDDREWIGVNSIYLQSKIGQNDMDLDLHAVQQQKNALENNQQESDEEGGQFKDLIVYYRFDDGKGDYIDDLSDYSNQGMLTGMASWRLLEEQPMEIEDKWGKKCPPQYAVSGTVKRQKRLGGRPFKNFTVQIWFQSGQGSFTLIKIGQSFTIGLQDGIFFIKTNKLTLINSTNEENMYIPTAWTNLSFVYTKQTSQWFLYINGNNYGSGKGQIVLGRDLLEIGGDFQGDYTQFRLWRKDLSLQNVKEYMRSPLEIVAEKRKKLKMKIKQKKKKEKEKEKVQGDAEFFPTFAF